MGSSDIGTSQHAPPSIVAQRGKVSEDAVESSTNDCWAVLQEREPWLYDSEAAPHLRPQARAFAGQAGTLPSDADVLAREARCEAIHAARPRGWIEQPNVSLVHVQAGEPAIGGALAQDGAAIGVPLDGADGLVSEDEVRQEATTCSSEEMDGSHGITAPAA